MLGEKGANHKRRLQPGASVPTGFMANPGLGRATGASGNRLIWHWFSREHVLTKKFF